MFNSRNYGFSKPAALLTALMFATGYASAQVQTVTGSLSVSELSAGQSTNLTVTYQATDDAKVTGLGLRLHYDSSVLEMGEYTDRLRESAQPFQIKDDTNDLDEDPTTDKYFLTSWADTSGDGWPYDAAQPATLYAVPLTAISGFNGSTLKFTASSTAAGYSLSAENVTINKIPGTVSTLSSLTASYTLNGTDTDITLSPIFDSATADYSATVAYPVTSASVIPVLTDSYATIDSYTANGEAVTNNTFDLSVGSNSAVIAVLAEDGTGTTTYSVSLSRAEAMAITVATPAVITTANQAAYDVSGTCNSTGVSVVVTLTAGSATAAADPADCTDSAWTTSVDASALADGSISISAVGSTSLETSTVTASVNKDTTGPSVSVPADISVAATDANGTSSSDAAISAFLLGATASDATDGNVSVTNDAPDMFPIGSTTVTFTAVDSLGNVGSNSATVTVEDQTAPVVTAPAATTVAATDANGTTKTDTSVAAFLDAATATDNVDANLTITNNAPDVFPLGPTTVTFSTTDSSGLTGSATAVLTVADQTAPVITAPASIIVAATDADGAAASDAAIAAFLSGASATDNVDESSAVTNDGLAVFPLGETEVTFSATDAAGNIGSASATVTVTDQTAPVITAPADGTIAATDASGTAATDAAVVAWIESAVATDNVDSNLTIINDAPETLPLGATVVTFTVTDAAGNTSSAAATATVADTTAPEITAPGTLVVLGTEEGLSAENPEIVAMIAGVSATDNVDGAITSISNDAPTDLFLFGETTVTFSATDAAGNTGTAQTIVNVSLDVVDPELTVPDSISINVDMPSNVVALDDDVIVDFLAAATATDNKDGDLTANIANDAPDEFEVGETVVTFSVSDAAGNTTTGTASVTVIVLDTDNDGLPDFYEEQNGLDPNDASDAEGDLDGDGISNLDEYLDGTDPTKDELPPVLTIPADISMTATGRMTDVTLGEATATDQKDGALTPTASQTGPFESGSYQITWTVSDAAGNVSTAVQQLVIMPLANLTPSSVTVEGVSVEVSVQLSGSAAAYPVTVPLTISGSATAEDFSIAESIVISEGTTGMVTMTVAADSEAETTEDVVITLGDITNAVAGFASERTVTITEDNVAPELVLTVTQGSNTGRVVAADGGTVTVTATYSDLNSADTHTLEWYDVAIEDMPMLTTDGDVATFDPSTFGDSVVSISADVTDSGNPSLTTKTSASIKVLATAPVLGDADSDGDGVSDADEGYGDSDNDGIPDYQDNIAESYLAPIGDSGQVVETSYGTTIALGSAALSAGDNEIGVDEEDVGTADGDYSYLGGLADFEVSGGQAGASYNVVLPLSAAVPANASVRKFIDANVGWQDFVLDANNAVSSATSASGSCPQPGNADYADGLTVGANCLQLLIEDGGANDADGVADGTVTDPSGIATLYFGPPSTDSTISIDVTELKAGGSETGQITVTAVDSDGRLLEGMSVTATASLSDASVDSFTEDGEGVYTATLTPGSTGGELTVTATISNGTDSASITSSAVTVKKKSGGGCTVGDGQSTDSSLILLLLASLMLFLRRRFTKA
ncbi:HYR domain-containing protein [Porticoccaceae bacterium]|nr:HYR domain-containing protein [Porticoccaceae bacterium]